MNLLERLRAMVAPMPPGSAVSLPVDWLRAELDAPEGPEPAAGAALNDLTLTEAAALVKRSESTLRTWCSRGLIPEAYKLRGRDWRIPPAALRAMLDREGEPKPDLPRRTRAPKGGARLDSWRAHVRKTG